MTPPKMDETEHWVADRVGRLYKLGSTKNKQKKPSYSELLVQSVLFG